MTIPTDKKEGAIYHTILAEMHRIQAQLLNMQTITDPDTAESLRQHFARDQSLSVARLAEWRQRRPDVFRQAEADFASFMRTETTK